MDRKSGEMLWRYDPRTLILHPSIAYDEKRVLFVEAARNVPAATGGRTGLSSMMAGKPRLTCLDLATGKVQWSAAAPLDDLQHTIFTQIWKGEIILTGTLNVDQMMKYRVRRFDGTSGQVIWSIDAPNPQKTGLTHGEPDQHPVIAGDQLYTRSFSLNLRTGKADASWIQGGGCGTLSACATAAFFKCGYHAMRRFDSPSVVRLTNVTRPNCWISIVPACGLVLCPEGSSGCTCTSEYGMQTTFALGPKETPSP